MPDIKTALATALKEWEPPTEGTFIEAASPAPAPKPLRNMTRDTFAMVRDNPGISRADAIERLETMGHKPTSTTSILSQMVKTKMISETGGILSTKRKNYTPLQTKVRKVDKTQAKVKAKAEDKPRVSKVAVPVGGGYYSTTEAAQAEWFDRTYPKDGEAALHPEATSTPQPLDSIQPQLLTMSLEEWLDTVPLKTARQVYWKLHGIFGGQAL
ncbi:hypothetical protein UFOVP1276_19 [uncultured Caudovirales phage]|uniref:Uncharacterized protein n=1 Tax=uncultured Caudovirales phage TaxID=2100421 RepID=A0A6J5RGA2_9CAUD|nr:hypothetical protein UFOVP875_50 [uncultured Caudovirales phage]CAB4195022.1 hypothetical protein UFOVP1276_19 [uncultured Caudovirales phage]CAB4205225.1 hypothetical protein UFOVP1403_47 [uncultured Caudovirales phage]CAB5238095.1 hypothetical protein UFOVP1507_31 [uncultured Caudovirales phage]